MAYFVDPALTFRNAELYFREIYIDSDTKFKNILFVLLVVTIHVLEISEQTSGLCVCVSVCL